MNIVSRKMDLNKIPTLKTIYWKVTDGYVVVDSSKGHFILNNSSSLVWRCIDGCKTISDIINEIYEWNIGSQKMFEHAGFQKFSKKDEGYCYRIDLSK